jgi:nuclear GTP-binding protein
MMLTDWLRGKIPYYNAPPEADADTIAKKQAVPGVEQIFSKIRVDTKFLKEDAVDQTLVDEEMQDVAETTVESAEAEPAVDWDDVFGGVVGETVTVVPETDIVEDEPALVDEAMESELDTDSDASSDDASTTEVEVSKKRQGKFVVTEKPSKKPRMDTEPEETAQEKHKRMTTNKRKVGVNFYDSANVKNRNREKQAVVLTDPKRLEKKLKGDGKRRR